MSASTELWLTFLLSMVLAYLTDRNSGYTDHVAGDGSYIRRNIRGNRFFYIMLVIVLVMFVGLRTWCNDTGTYIDGYLFLTSADGPILRGLDWSPGASPLFTAVNRILRHIGFSSQNFLMFYSLLTNGLYLWFVRKYSHDFSLSVFLFWTMGVYLFTAAAIRQTVAVAFGLIAVDGAAERNWKKLIFWCIVGCLFHPYVLLFLVAPFLQYPPWTKKSWLLIAACIACGVLLTYLLPTVLLIASVIGRGDEYSIAEFSGSGVNVFRFLVVWAPVVFSFFIRERMEKSDDRVNNMLMNLTMVNAGLMFIALFGTANYFARLANYFLIFQTLSLPWMLENLSRKNRRTMKIVIVLCYLLYFIFANVILTPFNTYFAKMTLGRYLRSLF